MSKKNKKETVNTKSDGVFRVFMKTNSMKNNVVYRVELSTNEVFENHYGNIVKYSVMEDSINQQFELYLNDQLVGEYILLECDSSRIVYDAV